MVLLGVYFELALRGQAQLTCTAQGNQLQLVHPIKTPNCTFTCAIYDKQKEVKRAAEAPVLRSLEAAASC